MTRESTATDPRVSDSTGRTYDDGPDSSATGRICERHAEQGDERRGEDEVGDRLDETGDAGEGDLGLPVSPVLGQDRHPQPERVGDDDREDERQSRRVAGCSAAGR